MKIIRFAQILCIFIFCSCKSSQPTPGTPATPPVASNNSHADSPVVKEPTEPVEPIVQKNPNENSYRFIISFISIGEGTDRNAKQILDSVLAEWETRKDQIMKINFETVPWGREGEVDFCFLLKELNDKEQIQFITGVKERFKGHQLVQFAENEPCRHKRD